MTHGPIRQEYAYDLDKNLTGLTVHSGDALLARNSYAYDGNGNRTLKRQLGGETLYHYDPLNQLKKVEYPGYTEELFYDKAGNRTKRIAQGVEELYQYDPRNRLTAYTKNGVTTMFQYDNAGNLLVDDKARYSYDAFNRTVKVETFDGNVQVNRYDAEGLRYEMEENGNLVQFIFNQEREVVTEEDSTGLTRLIRATELIARSSDSARTYYHYASDEMGSTTHIVDEAGNVQNRYEYDAWGNLTVQEETIPNRFKYTGQQFDPVTQQYYLRARFYNPVIARFTQEDTYRGDGLNLYAYCANNPVFYVDPSGNTATCLKDAYLKEVERLKSEYVNDSMSADEKAAAIKQARKDAYAAAKAVYEQNHKKSADISAIDLTTQLAGQDRAITKKQWDSAYQQARSGDNTPASIYADLVRHRVSKDTINSVAVIITEDGQIITGRNQEGVYSQEVQSQLDDNNIENKFQRQCAEVNAISKAKNQQIKLNGVQISVAYVRGMNSITGKHGKPHTPCDVCEKLIEVYNINYVE